MRLWLLIFFGGAAVVELVALLVVTERKGLLDADLERTEADLLAAQERCERLVTQVSHYASAICSSEGLDAVMAPRLDTVEQAKVINDEVGRLL